MKITEGDTYLMNKLSSNYDLKTHSAGISMRDFIYFIITIYNIISFNIIQSDYQPVWFLNKHLIDKLVN